MEGNKVSQETFIGRIAVQQVKIKDEIRECYQRTAKLAQRMGYMEQPTPATDREEKDPDKCLSTHFYFAR